MEGDPPTWALQHAFIPLLDAAAARALDEIGSTLAPAAHLIGFPAGDVGLPLILEQEGSPRRFSARDLEALASPAAEDLADPTPARPRGRSGRPIAKDLVRARELEEALRVAPAGSGRTFFAGRSASVGGFDIHPVLSVDAAAMSSVPQLIIRDEAGGFRSASLPHEVVGELLRGATTAVLAASNSDGHPWMPEDITADVVRRAANRLVLAAEVAAGAVATKDLFETFDALTSTAYEGKVGTGGVVLSARGHELVDVSVRLRRPVLVQDRRQFRKLLEMTEPGLDLLADGSSVYGLGCVSEAYDGAEQDIFRFDLVDQGVWQVAHHGQVLMQVAHGHAKLPRPRMSFPDFGRAMQEVFPGVPDADVASIWRLAEAVAGQPQGTLLVVSAAAEEEAARLASESLLIEPQPVDPRLVEAMTRIDGAVLLTPDGVCHAVGVILDGIATGTGDAGRGARYNSAVRYATASPAPCLVVVVSEDGMIDLHPEPTPRVAPEELARALGDLERAGRAAPPDLDAFYVAAGRLRLLASQMSPEQCARANAACERLAAAHARTRGVRPVIVPFEPARRRPRGA